MLAPSATTLRDVVDKSGATAGSIRIDSDWADHQVIEVWFHEDSECLATNSSDIGSTNSVRSSLQKSTGVNLSGFADLEADVIVRDLDLDQLTVSTSSI